jgi:hypothetical protein
LPGIRFLPLFFSCSAGLCCIFSGKFGLLVGQFVSGRHRLSRIPPFFQKNALVIFARIYFAYQNNFSASILFCAGSAQFVSSFFLFPVRSTIFACIALPLPALGKAKARKTRRGVADLLLTIKTPLPFQNKFFTFCGSFSHPARQFFHETPPQINILHAPFSAKSGSAALFRHNFIVSDKFWQALFPRFVSL